MATRERSVRSYQTYRPFLFGAAVFAAVAMLGYMAYTDFFSPEQPIKQPAFSSLPAGSPKKTDEQRAAYEVPADHPRDLSIDKLAVNANVVPLGTLKDSALDTPKTAWDVGWYDGSGLPGQPGTMVIDGHVNDTVGTPGVFYALHTLASGDTIKVERGDHQLFIYRVVATEQLPTGEVDMNKVLHPITAGKEGLNLITCGGTYDKKSQTYDQRVIVYSERVS